MVIILVEDDHFQTAWIVDVLRQRWPDGRIFRVSTEQMFYETVRDLVKAGPDVVLMDVMLRWTTSQEDMIEPPTEVKEEGYYRAGLRCERLLRSMPGAEHTQVVFYTVLEEHDLKHELDQRGANVLHLRKDADPEPLIEAIERVAACC